MVLFTGYGTGGSVTSSSVSIAFQAYLTGDSSDILLTDITVESSTYLLHTLEATGLSLGTKTGCYEVLQSFSQSRKSLPKFMPRDLSSRCVFCLLFTAHHL
jgi:alcohol dehydrogenase YqhD (iron-dependent ADH family)